MTLSVIDEVGDVDDGAVVSNTIGSDADVDGCDDGVVVGR